MLHVLVTANSSSLFELNYKFKAVDSPEDPLIAAMCPIDLVLQRVTSPIHWNLNFHKPRPLGTGAPLKLHTMQPFVETVLPLLGIRKNLPKSPKRLPHVYHSIKLFRDLKKSCFHGPLITHQSGVPINTESNNPNNNL